MKRFLFGIGMLTMAGPAWATGMPKCTAWVSDFLPSGVGQLRRILQEELAKHGQACDEAAVTCEAAAVTCQQTCGDVNIPPLDELCGPVTVEEGIAAVQAGYTRCRVKQGRNRLRVLCVGQE